MADADDDRVDQQVLDAVKSNQAAVVDAVRTWAESVQKLIPDVDAASVPGADALPSPADLVDRAYEFASELLAAQRDFTHELLAAATGRSRAAGGGEDPTTGS